MTSSSQALEIMQLNSKEAHEVLKSDRHSILVDVRTQEEWNEIGFPDLSNIDKEVIKLSWRIQPSMNINKNFLDELEKKVKDRQVKILFICRSGGRSNEAATAFTMKGYSNCINVAGGFEGSVDNIGWKNSNLPWRM